LKEENELGQFSTYWKVRGTNKETLEIGPQNERLWIKVALKN
jgi:hypothetical protein